jgi:hypothetical protein
MATYREGQVPGKVSERRRPDDDPEPSFEPEKTSRW